MKRKRRSLRSFALATEANLPMMFSLPVHTSTFSGEKLSASPKDFYTGEIIAFTLHLVKGKKGG